jgi:hypothetical protein
VLNVVSKVAIIVIVGSIVIGSAFGIFVTSNTTKNHSIAIDAMVISTPSPTTCGKIPANFTNWVQLYVFANQTDLQLISLTVVTPTPSISLQLPLNSTQSAYVYYHRYNVTQEDITVPLPNYWKPGDDLDLSVNYYYIGPNPTAQTVFTIGSRPITANATLSC